MTEPSLPPPPISSENLEIVRVVDPTTGFVVSKTVNKDTGEEVGLSRTQHLQTQAQGKFQPPPS
jgi:hypothetical protein